MGVPISSMAVTWNDGALHTAIKMNVTDVSSDSASLLMDIQVGGVSKFSVDKAGNIAIPVDSAIRVGGDPTVNISFSTNGGAYNSIDFNTDVVTFNTPGGFYAPIITGGLADSTLTLRSTSSGGADDRIVFKTNTDVEQASIDTAGNIILGTAAISTSATDGFLYIPTCAGTPTGTPTSQSGRVPMIYDTTNHQFWFYDSGWKQPKTPAGAAIVTWQ